MMALQKSILEQTDIVPVLKEFVFDRNEEEELTVRNPPNFKIGDDVFRPDPSEKINTTGSD